jgi:hypothetical protein
MSCGALHVHVADDLKLDAGTWEVGESADRRPIVRITPHCARPSPRPGLPSDITGAQHYMAKVSRPVQVSASLRRNDDGQQCHSARRASMGSREAARMAG